MSHPHNSKSTKVLYLAQPASHPSSCLLFNTGTVLQQVSPYLQGMLLRAAEQDGSGQKRVRGFPEGSFDLQLQTSLGKLKTYYSYE